MELLKNKEGKVYSCDHNNYYMSTDYALWLRFKFWFTFSGLKIGWDMLKQLGTAIMTILFFFFLVFIVPLGFQFYQIYEYKYNAVRRMKVWSKSQIHKNPIPQWKEFVELFVLTVWFSIGLYVGLGIVNKMKAHTISESPMNIAICVFLLWLSLNIIGAALAKIIYWPVIKKGK